MRSAAGVIIGFLVLGACAGPAAAPSPTPTRTPAAAAPTPAPTPAPAPTPRKETVTLKATLSAANEVPPIANDEKGATGEVTITFDVTKDAAGKVTAATAKFEFSAKGLTATSEITAAHIHNAPAGANAGVIVDTGLKAAEIKLEGGQFKITKTQETVKPETAEAILANPPGFYFNVHSKLNGGGVVRGQLTKG